MKIDCHSKSFPSIPLRLWMWILAITTFSFVPPSLRSISFHTILAVNRNRYHMVRPFEKSANYESNNTMVWRSKAIPHTTLDSAPLSRPQHTSHDSINIYKCRHHAIIFWNCTWESLAVRLRQERWETSSVGSAYIIKGLDTKSDRLQLLAFHVYYLNTKSMSNQIDIKIYEVP